MDKLKEILKLTQFELKEKLYQYLKEKQMSPIAKDGFVYAKGDIPILLVAHMDTVLKKVPTEFRYLDEFDELYSNEGIGGDDRCGVYAIMKILEQYRPYVLFTEDEEIGGIGAMKTVDALEKPDVKYIIELDRRGNNDCVFYDCGNTEFMDYIESFGFVTNYGTFSDISVLGKEWDIAAVNISSAYYYEHTKFEYIKFKELQEIINRVKNMVKNYQTAKSFDYQMIVRNKRTSSKYEMIYDLVDIYDDDIEYLYEDELEYPYDKSSDEELDKWYKQYFLSTYSELFVNNDNNNSKKLNKQKKGKSKRKKGEFDEFN